MTPIREFLTKPIKLFTIFKVCTTLQFCSIWPQREIIFLFGNVIVDVIFYSVKIKYTVGRNVVKLKLSGKKREICVFTRTKIKYLGHTNNIRIKNERFQLWTVTWQRISICICVRVLRSPQVDILHISHISTFIHSHIHTLTHSYIHSRIESASARVNSRRSFVLRSTDFRRDADTGFASLTGRNACSFNMDSIPLNM